jgi:hypothetical protein
MTKRKAKAVKVPAQLASDLMELNWLGHTFQEMVEFALRTYVVDRAEHLARVRAPITLTQPKKRKAPQP